MGSLSSMKSRFILLMVGVSLFTIFCVGSFFVYSIKQTTEQSLRSYRQDLQQNVDCTLRDNTQIALSVIKDIYKQQQAGLLTQEQAKQKAADIVRNLRYSNGKGYFWIDTYNGVNVVLLGNKNVEGKSRWNETDPNGQYFIQDLIKNGRKEGGGYTDDSFPKPGEQTPLPKRNYTVSFAPYNWVIGTGVWVDSIDAKIAAKRTQQEKVVHENIIEMLSYMLILQIVLIFLAVYLSKRFSRPIENMTEALNVLASGDFRNPVDESVLSRRDEIGAMGISLNKLRNHMRDLMKKIMQSSEYLASASEKLTSSADQSAAASSQVADSMVNVANLCGDQTAAVGKAGARSNDLSTQMQAFMTTIADSEKEIEKTNETAQKGNSTSVTAVTKMQSIEKAVEDTATVIAGLGEESKKIGVIVDTIANIASQTNLLALNAAIEAARAGEQGKGFAVVAEEVRKLAEESHTAADKIAGLIGSVQNEAQNAVSVMQEGVNQVKEGTDVVSNAGTAFGKIVKMVSVVSDQSREMGEIVKTLVDGVGEITATVDNINQMSKGVSSEAENVSAATEEQTASMQEIAESSRQLAKMAQDLQDAVNKFKI